MYGKLYSGCVEDRNDPLKLGRCRVRILGIHHEDKTILPTEELPWASPLMPINSAGVSGVGSTPVGPVPGTWVTIFFQDAYNQQPIMIGTIPGIPKSEGPLPEFESIGGWVGDIKDTVDDITDTIRDGADIIQGVSDTIKGSIAMVNEFKAFKEEMEDIFSGDLKSILAEFNIYEEQEGYVVIGNVKIPTKDAVRAEYAKLIKAIADTERDIKNIPEELLADITLAAAKAGLRDSYYVIHAANEKKFITNNFTEYANILSTKALADGSVNYLLDSIAKSGVNLADNIDRAIDSIENTVDTAIDITYRIDDAINLVTEIMSDPVNFLEEIFEVSVGNIIDTIKGKLSFIDDILDWIGTSMTSVKDGYNSISNRVGFSSPNGKWPLQRRMNEPDTNRLARGNIKDTAIDYIEKKRKKLIKTAFAFVNWDQPQINFGGEYPYTQVTESESGHVTVQDDTPGKESLLSYHRSGSFTHTDYKGAVTNKIVGSNYTIIDKNGRIYIEGACTVTIGRDTLLLVEGNLMVEVKGKTVLKSSKVFIN